MNFIFSRILATIQDLGDRGEAVRKSLRRSAPDWYNGDTDTWQIPNHTTETENRWDFLSVAFGPESSHLGLVLILLLVLFISLIIFQIIQIRTTRESKIIKKKTGKIEIKSSELPMDIDVSGNDLDAELAKRLDRGDHRGAIIVIYALYLVDLDRAGVITLNRGTTNRGYLRQVHLSALSSELKDHLSETVALFERVYFGGQSVDGATTERFRTRLPDFRKLPSARDTSGDAA